MTKNKRHIITCGVVVLVFALLSTLCFFGPKAEYSHSERRPLTSFPTLNQKSISSGAFMEQFERYAADTFPFREAFRSIKAGSTLAMGQKTNNGIYLHDGYLSRLEYPMDLDSIFNATEIFRKIYDKHLADANTRIYVSVIPDKNAYLAKNAGQLTMDYTAFEEQVAENMPFATSISILDLLSIEDYYRTDSHWRQEQIVDVAKHLANSMGTELVSSMYIKDLISATNKDSQPSLPNVEIGYTTNIVNETFYGVYHGQSALPIAGEQMYYLTNPIIDQLTVFDHENNREIPVYDVSKTTDKDPYELFLSGPLSLITLENPMAENDRELVIFRDSYASAIAPLLTAGYSKVTLVDIRYLPSSQIDKYVTFENCDVLFLYSTSVLNNSETLK